MKKRHQQANQSRDYRTRLVRKMDSGIHAIERLRELEDRQLRILREANEDPKAASRVEKLLKSHYNLTRQALGVLLAKTERLKRRVALLESKEEEVLLVLSSYW